MENHNNFTYVGTLFVGSSNHRQAQRCVFDTGSTNTWVSTTMQKKPGDIKGKHLLYNPELSSSFKQSGYQCSISFGSGELSGVFGWDDIWLGSPAVHVNKQQMGFVQSA